MKKKLLVLLLIITVAAFLFTGCTPHVDPEPEPEPGPTIDGVLVEFDHEYREGDKIYVAKGSNGVTVTFPAPVTGMVQIDLSNCTGDYSRGGTYLFPNEDKTVWTGSVDFECSYYVQNVCDTCVPVTKHCCATTVTIISGACEADTCIAFPVIVDCDAPFAELVVSAKDCCCSECAISIKSSADPEEKECVVCPETLTPCCGDTCSGLASWKVDVYRIKETAYPDEYWNDLADDTLDTVAFEWCCEVSTCAKLIHSCEGEECPIECVTDCIEIEEYLGDPPYIYIAVVTLEDNVGNTKEYYTAVVFDGTCTIDVYEGCCDQTGTNKGIKWSKAYEVNSDGKYLIGGCKGETDCPVDRD